MPRIPTPIPPEPPIPPPKVPPVAFAPARNGEASTHLMRGLHYGFLSQLHAVTVIFALLYLRSGATSPLPAVGTMRTRTVHFPGRQVRSRRSSGLRDDLSRHHPGQCDVGAQLPVVLNESLQVEYLYSRFNSPRPAKQAGRDHRQPFMRAPFVQKRQSTIGSLANRKWILRNAEIVAV